MPSATTKIPRSGIMRKLSSFPDRMTPTSVRPAEVMCTRSLNNHPVHQSDDPEQIHCGAAATAFALFLLEGRRWRFRAGLRLCRRRLGCSWFRRCRLCGRRPRGRGGPRGRGNHHHLLDHARPTTLRDTNPIVRRLEYERDVPEPNCGPRRQWSLTLDLVTVDESPIRRIEVRQYPYAFATLQLRMGGGDGFIGQDEVVVISPPVVAHGRLDAEPLSLQRTPAYKETRQGSTGRPRCGYDSVAALLRVTEPHPVHGPRTCSR